MSGSHEVAAGHQAVQEGPRGHRVDEHGFTPRQNARLDEALTLSSRETGLQFSVYIGQFATPTRAHAEAMFEKLTADSVLVGVSPNQRVLHIVTGPDSSKRLSNRACALAALAMRASFSQGDLVGGLVTGLRMLADSAGSP